MNKIYKLVWNASSGCWSVASEFARKGKPGRGTRRLIFATGLLSVSGAGMADTNATSCTDATPPPQTITCTGVTSPYKVNTDNTTLIMETGSSITHNGKVSDNGNGTGNSTHSLPVLLSNEEYKNNIQIINNGKLQWTEAEPPKESVNSSAAGLLYSENPKFFNEKAGEVLVETKENTQGSLSAVQLGYNESSGNANFTNNGKVTIKTTGPDTKLLVYGVRLYGNTLSASNRGSIVADNQGGILIVIHFSIIPVMGSILLPHRKITLKILGILFRHLYMETPGPSTLLQGEIAILESIFRTVVPLHLLHNILRLMQYISSH